MVKTLIFDSLNTINSSRLLVGHHRDDSLGLITSKAYFKLDQYATENLPENDAEYDFAEFELYYDDYFYYDTLVDLQLSLISLREELVGNDEDGGLYNIDSFAYQLDKGIVFSKTISPRPIREEKLVIPLNDDSIARAAFEMAQNNAFSDNFDELSNGFVLTTERSDNNGAFIGFSKGSRLVIHYTQGEQEEREMTIPVGNGINFNQITSNRKNTLLENLNTQQTPFPSSITGNTSYIQAGVGMALKVNFPGILRLKETLVSENVFDAELILTPISGSYDNSRPLYTNFDYYLLNRINQREQLLDFSTRRFVNSEFGEAYYQINVAEYLKFELDREDDAEKSLLLVPQNIGQSIDRMYLDGNRFKVELKIYVFDYSL